jgi:hypothetical protein
VGVSVRGKYLTLRSRSRVRRTVVAAAHAFATYRQGRARSGAR